MNPFEALGISEPVVRAITEAGFTQPTPIQAQTLPLLLGKSSDLVALAQTGTGKTAAFGLPLSQLTDFTNPTTQALILCPTRELCMQITSDLKMYTKYMRANIVAIYGGASISGQMGEIRRGASIIVGTPGRMVDMIDRGVIKLNAIKFVVLDEADEMLNMGFQEDLDKILSKTSKEKHTWLFSATMPREVSQISRKYMSAPQEITVGNKNQGADTVEHLYYTVQARDRYKALKRILDFNPNIYAITFCRTKNETQEVAEHLIKDGYPADSLHGDLSQAQRDHVMKRFRGKLIQVLVATDVAARGIDVDDITHVINYNLPDEIESYTHRSGRTGRAGKSGISIIIIGPREIGKIRQIERIINKQFKHAQIPSGIEICERQLMKLITDVKNVKVDETAIEKYLPSILEQLQDMDKEELIKRFVFDEFNRFLEYYKKFPDLNSSHEGEGRSGGNGNQLFINLGRLDGFTREQLMDYLNQITDIKPAPVTNLELKHSFSFLDVNPADAARFTTEVSNMVFKGRKLRVGSPEQGERRGGGGSGSSRGGYSGGRGGYSGGNRSGGSYSGGGRREGSGGYSGSRDRDRSSGSSSPRREGGKRPRNKYGSGGGSGSEGGGRSDRFKK